MTNKFHSPIQAPSVKTLLNKVDKILMLEALNPENMTATEKKYYRRIRQRTELMELISSLTQQMIPEEVPTPKAGMYKGNELEDHIKMQVAFNQAISEMKERRAKLLNK